MTWFLVTLLLVKGLFKATDAKEHFYKNCRQQYGSITKNTSKATVAKKLHRGKQASFRVHTIFFCSGSTLSKYYQVKRVVSWGGSLLALAKNLYVQFI